MSWALGRRTAPHALLDHTALSNGLAAGSLVAACAHLILALEHGASLFALCVAAAGIAQVAIALCALRGRGGAVAGAAMVLSLVLIQLYTLNVTTGLPPLIAHTNALGTHSVLGVTLAWPNQIDAQGVLTQVAQAVALACAVGLGRLSDRKA
jgi:hypothetical protein